MHYKLFSIGPITIYSYGFMIALGFLAAILLAMYRSKKYEVDGNTVIDLALCCIVGGLLGAKLLYLITDLPNLIPSKNVLSDITNGFVVYGGILGGVLACFIYTRRKKVNFLKCLDLIAPSVAIGQCLGRIGCLMAGCCYGRETTCSIGIVFQNSPMAPNGIRLLPTQIFSSVGDLLLAIVLILYARRKPTDGRVINLYLILYGVGRFIIEIFRNDPRGNVGFLSTSQFISIFIVIFGMIQLFCLNKRDKLNKETQKTEES